ncbi:MAG: peptide chain release factor N(5)-glutamine methyltransferase [Alicyclobacillaceae bacterium]|nr:peptide chain release factor N(5)-glutamine methyltransferase [Alicyclobacillaceae bacterium]
MARGGTSAAGRQPPAGATAITLLRWACDRFAASEAYLSGTGDGAGARSPAGAADRMRREAEELLMWAAGWDRLQLLTALAEPVAAAVRSRFAEAVKRRAAAWPLQYITGQASFYGRTFLVRPGVLIPRPETEVLAQEAIRWIQRHQPQARVLDIGTGSGVLAVTIALECPRAAVEAVDIAAAAAEVAAANAARLGAALTVAVEDGLARLQQAQRHGPRYHVLVSNPPYIPAREVDRLPLEVRGHEPRAALEGGADGLDLYRRLAEAGPGAFAPGPASFWVEVGYGQADQVVELFRSSGRWAEWRFRVIADLRGIPRVVGAERFAQG